MSALITKVLTSEWTLLSDFIEEAISPTSTYLLQNQAKEEDANSYDDYLLFYDGATAPNINTKPTLKLKPIVQTLEYKYSSNPAYIRMSRGSCDVGVNKISI